MRGGAGRWEPIGQGLKGWEGGLPGSSNTEGPWEGFPESQGQLVATEGFLSRGSSWREQWLRLKGGWLAWQTPPPNPPR